MSRDQMNMSIIAVGASAGGLDAIRAVFSALPSDTGPAFIIVQHLSSSSPSHMEGLLGRVTALPIETAEDGTRVQPGHIYLMPPGRYIHLEGDTLRVTDPSPKDRPPHPVDHLFISLADTLGDRAVGVILSGTGSDGTAGAAAIRSTGGLVIAQDEASAEYTDMPGNAARAGNVDRVLPPDEIAAMIDRLGTANNGSLSSEPEDPEHEATLKRIVGALSAKGGLDFTHYRSTTVERRLERRRMLTESPDLAAYAERVEQDPDELAKLFEDLLIHVTNFFRDPDVFEAVEREVWPKVLADKAPGEPVRIWVPACSTGQEVYSLAMSLVEQIEEAGLDNPIQIFATDANDRVLEQARRATYGPDTTNEVGPERLERFFDRHEDGYRIKPALRDLCVFARHDVTNDPPFLRLDLISCRNLLIYLSPGLQERVVSIFHHGIVPGGFLLLGRSEAVGEGIGDNQLFTAVDKVHKIYRRRPGPSTGLDLDTRPRPASGERPRPGQRREPTADQLRKEADRLVIATYAPPSVLVDSDLRIIHFRGDTSPYLRPPEGAATYQLLNMVPDILSVELREAIEECRKTRTLADREGVRFRVGKEVRAVDIRVLPLHSADRDEPHFLVLFQDPPVKPMLVDSATDDTPERVHEIDFLRRELAASRGSMQAVIDEQESMNRELRTAIEESVASNEELQSTNEELESAKEELQAMNEEVTTLNEELRNQNQELKDLKEYAEAIVDTVRHPLVVLGRGLLVRSANDAFYAMFDTSPERAIGLPLNRLGAGRFDHAPLATRLDRVVRDGGTIESHETTFQGLDGRPHLLSSDARHLTTSNGDPLVLVAMEDITSKEATAHAELEAERLRGAIEEAERFNLAISHDLRTPIKAIMGFTERLLKDKTDRDDGEVKKLDCIAASAARMDRTINGMLNLTRVSHTKIHRQTVDASAMVRTLIDQKCKAAGVEIETDIEQALQIDADPGLLETLLGHIIENATRFVRPVKGPRIRFREMPLTEEREYVLEDNGTGFPAKDAERLFEPFVRLNNGHDQEGVGIGLAIVRRIAQRHGGHAWAEGSPKKGARIHFTLGEET
ncbi:MAG: PAS domain-containing protein [Euryarchaeota archaeon]|nr:PAS domain-containing protein [Euryarchaeota archaeon]